jgi:Heparan-alpha-glucosaminide N-acetyltransferase, catalytic
MMPSFDKAPRLRYLDWTRGFAALIMLHGHAAHSFTRMDLRDQGPFVLSQFLGGIAPAIFLFLTGATMAFRMDSDERSGKTPFGRVLSALSRARYLLIVAMLFRIQLWAFSWPSSQWPAILKVDVLNCMALAGAALSAVAALRTIDRARLGVTLGLAIAVAGPLVSQLDWSGVPGLVKNYIAPDYLFFSFFPWASFFAFGLSAGSVIRLLRDDQMDRAMQWAALVGAALIVGGRYFSELPYSLYSKSEFWLDSPALTLIKLGVVLWIVAFAFLWTRYAMGPGWSMVSQIGTTSLLVYWVHVELVYGRWLGVWKESLDNTQVAALSVIVIGLMLALSVLRTASRKWSAMPAALRWYPFTSPREN